MSKAWLLKADTPLLKLCFRTEPASISTKVVRGRQSQGRWAEGIAGFDRMKSQVITRTSDTAWSRCRPRRHRDFISQFPDAAPLVEQSVQLRVRFCRRSGNSATDQRWVVVRSFGWSNVMRSIRGLLFLIAGAIVTTVFCLLMILRISTDKGELQIKALIVFVTVLVLGVWTAGRGLWRLGKHVLIRIRHRRQGVK
jgi:hypothetical protein